MSPLTNIQSIPYFIPELILVVFAVGAILLDLVNKGKNTERVAYLALIGVAATLVAVIAVGSSEHRPLPRHDSARQFRGVLQDPHLDSHGGDDCVLHQVGGT